MSPGRAGPSPSKSRPPFPHDISSATKGDSPVRARSQSDVGEHSRGISGNELNRSPNVPFMIGEGKGEDKTSGLSALAEGARCFDSAVEVASFAASPPDLASPPNVRSGLFNRANAVKALSASSPAPASPATRPSAKPVGHTSGAAQVKNAQTSSTPESRTGEKGVEASDLVAVPAKTTGDRCRTPSPANSPGRAKSMEEGGMPDKGGGRDTGLASPAPVFPEVGAGPAPSTPTSPKAEASGGDNREVGEATEHPAPNGSATIGRHRTFSEAERDLRHLIGLGSPDASAPENPPVPGSDGRDSAHSSVPVPDTSGHETPGSGPPVLDTLLPGPPSSSSSSTNYSAYWIVLPEGAENTTSPQGLSDLDVGVASSAGEGGELTQYSIGGFGGSPHDDEMSTHQTLDEGLEELKGGSEESHENWAPPVAIDIDRLGFDAFLLEESDDDQPRSDGVGDGAAEEKGPALYQTPSSEITRQLQVRARSDGIRGGVLEEKGAPPNQPPPRENEQVFELAPRACSYRRESGAAEEKGSSTYRVSSAEKDGDSDAHTVSDSIEGGGTVENDPRTSSTTNPSFDRLMNPNESVHHALMPSGSRPPPGGKHNADRDYAISDCDSADHRKPGYNHENSNLPGDASSYRIPGQSASIRPPPVSIDIDRLGFDAFLLEESDDDQPRSDGVRDGAAEEKGPALYQTPSAEITRQLQVRARSDGIEGGVLEEKGAPPNQPPPCENGQGFELAPRACSYRRESGAAEEKGPSTYRVSSAEKDGDSDTHTVSDSIEGVGTEENNPRTSSTTNHSFDRPPNPNESVHHALMPPGSRPPPCGNHNADRDYAISDCDSAGHRKLGHNHENSNEPGDTSSYRIPGQSASIRAGGLSPADLKPCSAVLPDSPLPALLGQVSPRRGTPPPSKSRPPLLHDISSGIQGNLSVRSKPDGYIGDKERATFDTEQSRRHSAPFAIDEGLAETDKRGRAAQREGARSSGSAVEGTTLTSTSPGFASPVILPRAKLASSKSVAQGTPVHQSSRPSTYRSGGMDGTTSNLISVPANSSVNNGREISRTNSSGGATAMEEDVERENEGGRDTILGMDSPVLPPVDSSAVTESKVASSCHKPSSEMETELETGERSKGMGGGLVEEKEISPYHISKTDTEQDFDTPAHSVRIERGAPTDTGASFCSVSPAETNEDANCTPRLANSSGIANLTGEDRTVNKGDRGDKSLTSLAAVPPPTDPNCAATAPICSETKASGEGSSRERAANDDPASSNRATNDRAMQRLAAERELRTVLGLRLPDISALGNTLGTEPEVSSTHSSALISVNPTNGASVADGPESQVQVSSASAPHVPAPCTPGSDVSVSDAYSPPFATHSACGTVLPDGFTIATSLGGVSDLDVGMASSAGRGSALTQYVDDGHSGPLHHGKLSSRETVDQLREKSKRGSVESPPISAPRIEIDDHHLGLDDFLLAHSDDGHPRSDGITGGLAEEEKGPSSDQRPSVNKASEVEARVRPGGIGDKITQQKGVPIPFCQTTPTDNGRELDRPARSEVVEKSVGGESGASAEQMSTAEKERELKMVLGLIPAFADAQMTMDSGDPPTPTSSSEPRWGNTSTTVPLEERQRRDQELFDAVQSRQETGTEEEWVEAQPASFPDESTWPSGEGFAEFDGPGDRLPPPSDYEVQESAKMYARYEEAMRELGLEP